MTVGILAVTLTTAPVNADAAGRGSAEERNRLAGIPTCNAAGTAHVNWYEGIARAFGKPVPKDPNSPIQVCNDGGVLRILQEIKPVFRSFVCRMSAAENGMILHIETTPENEAVNRKQAALYAKTIRTSPKFEYAIKYINDQNDPDTISDRIVTVMYAGPEDTLDDRSHNICGTHTPLWNPTDTEKDIAATVHEIVRNYGVHLTPGKLTLDQYFQFADDLERIPALD